MRGFVTVILFFLFALAFARTELLMQFQLR